MRRLLVLAACGCVALLCALVNISHVSLLPPGLEKRQLEVAGATTRVTIDLPASLRNDALAPESSYQDLQARSVLVANLMTSERALAFTSRRTGIPREQIAANTRVMVDVQTAMLEPDSERRAAQLADSHKPYQLEVRPDPYRPKLTVYTQAPTVAEAEKLADGAIPGVQDFLADLARKQGGDPSRQVQFQQLGRASGFMLSGGTTKEIFLLTFMLAFAAALLVALAAARLLRRTPAPPEGAGSAGGAGGPAVVFSSADVFRPAGAPGGALALPAFESRRLRIARAAAFAARAGDWPRTGRVLPWLVAAFMVVIWLVPFNEIKLAVSLPIDLKFDRLVLPVLAGVWALVLAAGGRDRPRIQITWIHVAVAAVVFVACLSLVMAAHSLAETLEFDTAVKKLTLLGSYAMMFVIVASVVRKGEVYPFMSFTLILASICALGVIIEYRFSFNLFFWASGTLLPGGFEVGQVTPDGVDEIGRRLIRGPGQVSLETVAMLAMALPIALSRLLQSHERRQKLIYAAVTALLMAAMVSTFRKTALIAPVSVCLTFAYFRRRELLKLAPLGIVLILIIQVLSPGALTGVTSQLDRSRLGVTTVSDRTADYDAIRPDLWSHLAFGRGYGSYEHTSYRILDMELLRQIIEVGVVGLIAYLLMAVAVIAVARGPIRARGPDAPVALAVAASAVCFLVVSTLFDVMSFPHVPYIFLWMAAMLAVMTAPDREAAPWRR